MLSHQPRRLLEEAQSGSLNDQDLALHFQGLSYANSNSLANRTYNYIQRNPDPLLTAPIDSEALKHAARAFHERAGTATNGVLNNIEGISDDTPRIRVAHQANLFPSLGVASQFFLLQTLAQNLNEQHMTNPSQLFIIVDYDEARDQRFRVAHFPNVRGQMGSTFLSSAIHHSLLGNPMWSIAKPERATVEEWVAKLSSLTRQDLKSLSQENLSTEFVEQESISEKEKGSIEKNVEILKDLIWTAFERADTLVEFNAFFLSYIVNIYWKMPVAFVFGSKLQPLMLKGYELLIEHWPEISTRAQSSLRYFQEHNVLIKSSIVKASPAVLPIWITCSGQYNGATCFRRLPLNITSNTQLIAYSHCERCGADYRFDLGTYKKVQLEPLLNHNLAPRILLDNLLDTVSLGIVGGVGYAGQAEHMLLTNYIASKVADSWETPPHILWQPKGFFYGLTECRALRTLWGSEPDNSAKRNALKALRWAYFGKASLLYYLISLGTEGLLDVWNDFSEIRKQGQEKPNSVYSALDAAERTPLNLNTLFIHHMRSLQKIIEETNWI
jgi:hypothetical protein